MAAIIQQSLIKPFVQTALGCQCPEEVFSDIEVSQESYLGICYQRILTGQRLLVYVCDGLDSESANQLMRKGRSERDEHGFNRFRLAVIDNLADAVKAQLQADLEAVMAGDPKLHFHFLSKEESSLFVQSS